MYWLSAGLVVVIVIGLIAIMLVSLDAWIGWNDDDDERGD